MNDWLDAEQRVERAQQLSESQRWAEALAEIDAALAINPTNATWHAHRGMLLEELDRWEDAADAFAESLKIEPSDRDTAVALGSTLYRLGRLPQAIQVFERLAKLYPNFEPAYCHRVGIYAELANHEQAEQMFYIAQELNESCPHCFVHIADSLMVRGQSEKALFCWKRALEIDPGYVGVNRQIGKSYRLQGRFDLARKYYLREVRDDPGNIDLLYELADLALESGETAAATAKLAHILELDPGHIESRFMLGKIWLRRGQPGQALVCFEAIESLGFDRFDLESFDLCVGDALFRLGRLSEARRRFEEAATDGPCEPDALLLLGDCLVAMAKPADAADAYRCYLAETPDDAVVHHKLAVCLGQTGLHGGALEHCKQALKIDSGLKAAAHTAVVAHLGLAQWSEARAMMRTLRRDDRKDPKLRQLRRRLRSCMARHYWRRLTGLIGLRTGSD